MKDVSDQCGPATKKIREGEVATLVLKHFLRARGMALLQPNSRELSAIAKETGVPIQELKDFMKPIVQELVDEALGVKKS